MTLSSLYLHWDTTLWHLLRVRMVQFTGEYKQEKQENIDAYLTAVGMPWIARKTAGNITPALGSKYVRGWGFGTKYFPPNFELEVTKNGDEWTMTWKSTMMSSTAKFTIGVEFVEKNPRGKEIKVKSFMIFVFVIDIFIFAGHCHIWEWHFDNYYSAWEWGSEKNSKVYRCWYWYGNDHDDFYLYCPLFTLFLDHACSKTKCFWKKNLQKNLALDSLWTS